MDGPSLVVEAFAGYKGEKTPRSFTFEGKTLHVLRVVDRWYTDTHSFFRVQASDGQRYVLRLDLDEDCWELIMLERAGD
ncbi:MAG TPA: hypothetical protein VFM24_03845 [Nitrospira sp.]|nr:hypothetical protein [Nitrospira sp.]